MQLSVSKHIQVIGMKSSIKVSKCYKLASKQSSDHIDGVSYYLHSIVTICGWPTSYERKYCHYNTTWDNETMPNKNTILNNDTTPNTNTPNDNTILDSNGSNSSYNNYINKTRNKSIICCIYQLKSCLALLNSCTTRQAVNSNSANHNRSPFYTQSHNSWYQQKISQDLPDSNERWPRESYTAEKVEKQTHLWTNKSKLHRSPTKGWGGEDFQSNPLYHRWTIKLC